MDALADPVLLSRLQMAFTLSFHILFPTLTIGLSAFLVFLHGRWLLFHDDTDMRLFRFWMRIFALGFGVGVVSGIVLSFEFGTNFAPFSQFTGNVLAPLLSYEVLMAFFLEASFLPLLLFGFGRVGPRLHFFATLMVATGTLLSAFWILSANSWMHTPAGYALRDGVIHVTDWFAAIFNPSFPFRFAHMVMASFLTGAFVVAGVSAWHLLRGRCEPLARRGLSLALWAALVCAPAQVLLGDLHGLNTRQVQPVKLAAMEALWETRTHAPFVVFAWPDQVAQRNHWELGIPLAGSLILTHAPDGQVAGLDQVGPAERPHVATVFWAFRIMLFIGFLLLALAVVGLILRLRGALYSRRWYLLLLVAASPLGFVAVLAGWTVTEVGRQPWAVQGLLRTVDAATPLPAASVGGSVILFLLLYHALLLAFLYFLYRMVRQGPEEQAPARRPGASPRTAWYSSMEDGRH